MRRPIALSVAFLFALLIGASAEASSRIGSPAKSVITREGTRNSQIFEFRNAPVPDTLRELARLGRLNISIGDDIHSRITLKTQTISARQAIQRIADLQKLIIYERDGIIFIRTKEGHTLDEKRKNPAAFWRFIELVRAKAPKSEFDKLPCRQRRVGSWDELERYVPNGSVESFKDSKREFSISRVVIAYDLPYLHSGAVFFGEDLRHRYDYLGPAVRSEFSDY